MVFNHPKHLLAFALTDGIAGMSGRAAIDGTAAPHRRGVLRDVGGDAQVAQVRDVLARVVRLVLAEGQPLHAGTTTHHHDRGVTLGRPGGGGYRTNKTFQLRGTTAHDPEVGRWVRYSNCAGQFVSPLVNILAGPALHECAPKASIIGT